MASEKRKQSQSSSKEAVEKQFEFALFQIQNIQELVRRADSKAQFNLGANAVLLSATVALISDLHSVFSHNTLIVIFPYLGLLIVFAITGLISMTQAFLVVYPTSSAISSKSPKSVDGHLLYFREIVHTYSSSTEYKQSLQRSSLQDILENVSQQIYTLSQVASKKYDLLRASTKWLIISLVAWVIILVSTVLL